MHNIDFRFIMLAALHFNENVNKVADGTVTPKWKVSYTKYKEGKVVTKVTPKVTHGRFIFYLAFCPNSLTRHGSNATWNSSATENNPCVWHILL